MRGAAVTAYRWLARVMIKRATMERITTRAVVRPKFHDVVTKTTPILAVIRVSAMILAGSGMTLC